MQRTIYRGSRRAWLIIVTLVLLLAGCSSQPDAAVRPTSTSEFMVLKPGGKPKLRIMAGGTQQRGDIKDFEQQYGVEVEWISTGNSGTEDILAALDSSQPPDLIELEYSQIRDFIDYDVFEPLDLAPYHAKSVISFYFPDLNLSYFRSLDRQHIVFMPQVLQAGVTYYRADLMKENGFPDDPEALGKYMESPDRWLAMAKKLAIKGKLVMQRPTDLLQALELSNGFFDIYGSFTRNTTAFVFAIEIAKEADKLGLPLGASIWETSGQDAIRNGKLIMFTNGEWGDSMLQSWAPDTYHLWRKTRLPLNQYGIITGLVSAIPKNSRNKELAWKFAQYQLQQDQGYLNTLEISKWYDKMNEVRRTPLDAEASGIWEREISWRIATPMSPEQIASTIESNIMAQLADRLELMAPLNTRR